jgi:hypothetical protein
VFDVAANARLPDVPASPTERRLQHFLPWGPFFGVFVKKGTPDDAVAS